MVRLLHTADVHLGAKFLGLGDKGAAQSEQIRASFKKLISQAIVENIDIVLIAGTHDCFDSSSIYKKVDLAERCPNLTLFTDQGWNYEEFPSLGLTVYGKPNCSKRFGFSTSMVSTCSLVIPFISIRGTMLRRMWACSNMN